MKLWMSRSRVTHGFTFWRRQPDISWSGTDEICIGYDTPDEDKICELHRVHKLFPALEIPSGEMVEVEVVEIENGYYIGIIE